MNTCFFILWVNASTELSDAVRNATVTRPIPMEGKNLKSWHEDSDLKFIALVRGSEHRRVGWSPILGLLLTPFRAPQSKATVGTHFFCFFNRLQHNEGIQAWVSGDGYYPTLYKLVAWSGNALLSSSPK